MNREKKVWFYKRVYIMMLIWFQFFSIFSPFSLKQKLEIKVEKRDESCSLNDVKSFDLINTASSMADLIDPLDLASGSKRLR